MKPKKEKYLLAKDWERTFKTINSLSVLLSSTMHCDTVYSIVVAAGLEYDRVFFKELSGDWMIFEDVVSGEKIRLSTFGFDSVLNKLFNIYVFPHKQIGYKSETGRENEA